MREKRNTTNMNASVIVKINFLREIIAIKFDK